MKTTQRVLELAEAMSVLGLASLPGNRQELARRIAAQHPACQPWNGLQTSAYRVVWEALEPARRAVVPLAA